MLKMEFHVLLFVLAITKTLVSARPNDALSRENRSIKDGDSPKDGIKSAPTNGTEEVLASGLTLKLPTALQHEWKIYIDGTVDVNSETIEIVFPSRDRTDEEYCRFIHDKKNQIMTFFEVTNKDDSPKKIDYPIFPADENRKDYVPFQLELEGKDEGEKAINLTLDLNTVGKLDRWCYLRSNESFEDFERIEFRKGLHKVTSLKMLFEE